MTSVGIKRPVNRALSHMWNMGGRICDLSADQLDRLAAMRMVTAWLPTEVGHAQQQIDAREVEHAQL